MGEFDESLVLLDTRPKGDDPAVIWCEDHDIHALAAGEPVETPDVWESFGRFFSSCSMSFGRERIETKSVA